MLRSWAKVIGVDWAQSVHATATMADIRPLTCVEGQRNVRHRNFPAVAEKVSPWEPGDVSRRHWATSATHLIVPTRGPAAAFGASRTVAFSHP